MGEALDRLFAKKNGQKIAAIPDEILGNFAKSAVSKYEKIASNRGAVI